LSDGQKKKYIEMFSSFTEPFNYRSAEYFSGFRHSLRAELFDRVNSRCKQLA